jgi:predicted MFS family arabinose efflux permease
LNKDPYRPNWSQRASDFFGVALGLISLMFVLRLVIDTSFRMFFPFIPQFSNGLNLTIAGFSWLLTIRSTSGFLGPFIGVLADRYGRRRVMAMALLLRAAGMIGLALSSGWWSVIPMFLTGVATTAYLPAQQAYISDQVTFERRGRALAAVDVSFSISGILGLPLVGWLIDIWGWRAPFWVLAALSLVAMVIILRAMPKTEIRSTVTVKPSTVWATFRQSRVLASIVVSFLLFTAVAIYMTFWGLWLSNDFGLEAVELGLVGTRIGFAELAGVIASGLLIDRIGKRRGSLFGLIGSAVVFMVVPLFQINLTTILGILIVLGVVVEFTITALFPLYGEQAPEARATIFSLVAFGNALGIGLGPPLTALLWDWQGLGAITAAAAVFLLLAAVITWKFLWDQQPIGGKI